MIDHLLHHTLPAVYSLLPAAMDDPAASALLLAIGLQESELLARHQAHGPARGFWQFERAGVVGVLQHPHCVEAISHVLRYLRYATAVGDASFVHRLIEDNDTLAACLARLLLWTLPQDLPRRDQPEWVYAQYVEAWRPGKPRPNEWHANYQHAWECVSA